MFEGYITTERQIITRWYEISANFRLPTRTNIGVCARVLKAENNSLPGYTLDYRAADMSLARPISRCIVFDGENISFEASLVLYI